MNILNQFSYPIIAIVVCVVLFVVLKRYAKANWQGLLGAELLAIAIFFAGWILLQPGAGDAESINDVQTLLESDRPTFIEFFSNYCTGCLLLRPSVDQIIDGIEDEFNILRVNIHSGVGRELRERYDFSFTPEFVLVTANGEVVWRDHVPPGKNDLARARVDSAAMN